MIACKGDKFKFPDRLDGSWKIVKSERWAILADGTTDQFEDLSDAGSMQIYEPSPPAETLKEFLFTYTNFQGDQVQFNSLLYTDVASSRVMMSQVLCNSPFECDIVWTVDVNKKNKQVWSVYGTEAGFFYAGNRYDASSNDFHLKWTITLERE